MQENGPFLWQPGVFKPVKNDWSWHKLTNIVWIDQPIGSGFSQGTVTATDENDVAQQFMGFWKNFVDTFSMQGYKVYITGSSYSGMYSPYIASAMLDANDKTYFNVTGMQIWDGVFGSFSLAEDIVTVPFVDKWKDIFALNDTFTESMHKSAQGCGYTDYLNKYLVYPPAGSQPAFLPGLDKNNNYLSGCDMLNTVFEAAQAVNPCFSPYTITNLCPLKFDPLGFSDGYEFIPSGSGPVYLDRPDVKAVIHAPENQTWVFCSSTVNRSVFVNGTDNSLLAGPASQPVLPNVIDRTKNVIIGHGSQDFVLPVDGALLAIQNITFGGKLGFQTQPSSPLIIPLQNNSNPESMAGGGIVGIVHTERGLTFLEVNLAGHFLTQDAPAVAFRSLEVLLGRIDGFQSTQGILATDQNSTTQSADAQSTVSSSLASKSQTSGASIKIAVETWSWIVWAGIPISAIVVGLN
jgi:carboxypeptidase D